ncbi:MAG: cell division protein FtsA [Candidatus Omnitrophica bacterium]|nr:cell division protein FtsA [Candidatus Omnitrophota bacterium]
MFQEKIVCGLDLGSQCIKAGLLRIKDPRRPDLVGVCENKVYGFKDFSVLDLGELSECVHLLVNQLSKKTGYSIKDVQLGICSGLAELREANTVIPLVDRGNKVIAKRDIKRVNTQARLLGVNMEEEILHEVSHYYRVDDVNFARNPLGLYGRKLGVYSTMIVSDSSRLQNIIKAIHQAGYDTSHIFLSSYAASEVVLAEQDRQEGVALVDIGATQTTLLVFKERHLRVFKKIHIGGNDFTKNIANTLNLSFDLAEEIKKSYASVLKEENQQGEEILVKKDDTYLPVKKERINTAIETVIKRLVHSIFSLIETTGFADQLNNGMVVIGGGSMLPGLIEKIGQGINVPVQSGQIQLNATKKLSNTALFSSVVGLAHMSFNTDYKVDQAYQEPTSFLNSVTNRICELYQDYF